MIRLTSSRRCNRSPCEGATDHRWKARGAGWSRRRNPPSRRLIAADHDPPYNLSIGLAAAARGACHSGPAHCCPKSRIGRPVAVSLPDGLAPAGAASVWGAGVASSSNERIGRPVAVSLPDGLATIGVSTEAGACSLAAAGETGLSCPNSRIGRPVAVSLPDGLASAGAASVWGVTGFGATATLLKTSILARASPAKAQFGNRAKWSSNAPIVLIASALFQ
jgi:hypothetical protein